MEKRKMDDKKSGVKFYRKVNNRFKKRAIYRVGSAAGFYSEINTMLAAMLYCYAHKIQFVLYADDANFAGGNGWKEFFLPFCPQNHDKLNTVVNYRLIDKKADKHILERLFLKFRGKAIYLTSDIFYRAGVDCPEKNEEIVKWEEFGIDGYISEEFVKLRKVALRYNKKTFEAIKEKIRSIELPKSYYSIQLRGGDKVLEFRKPITVDHVIKKIENSGIMVDNLFVFTDDYRFVKEIKSKRPDWSIYTLTDKNESGYVNKKFQRSSWDLKRKEMIKLFAMVEICLHSRIHFGCETTCVNAYIKYSKGEKEYYPVWTEEEAGKRFKW